MDLTITIRVSDNAKPDELHYALRSAAEEAANLILKYGNTGEDGYMCYLHATEMHVPCVQEATYKRTD
jgi:hypothetical protein